MISDTDLYGFLYNFRSKVRISFPKMWHVCVCVNLFSRVLTLYVVICSLLTLFRRLLYIYIYERTGYNPSARGQIRAMCCSGVFTEQYANISALYHNKVTANNRNSHDALYKNIYAVYKPTAESNTHNKHVLLYCHIKGNYVRWNSDTTAKIITGHQWALSNQE